MSEYIEKSFEFYKRINIYFKIGIFFGILSFFVSYFTIIVNYGIHSDALFGLIPAILIGISSVFLGVSE